MRQRSRGTKTRKMTAAQRAAQAAREAKVLRVQLALGYVVVAISVVAGFFINLAVGLGFAVLAAIRLYALRKEIRRQAEEGSDTDAAPPSRRPMRTSAGRVS